MGGILNNIIPKAGGTGMGGQGPRGDAPHGPGYYAMHPNESPPQNPHGYGAPQTATGWGNLLGGMMNRGGQMGAMPLNFGSGMLSGLMGGQGGGFNPLAGLFGGGQGGQQMGQQGGMGVPRQQQPQNPYGITPPQGMQGGGGQQQGQQQNPLGGLFSMLGGL